ncbi:MAG: ABC transporter permease [Bacteroidota bacterium]
MLKNYLLVAWRSLRRQKGYAFINIVGLALGLTCCVLIAAYVWDELRYDRFHENADRIQRLRVERFAGDGSEELTVGSSPPMAPAAIETFPEIEAAVRILDPSYFVASGQTRLNEDDYLWADAPFFVVFDGFDLLHGDPATVITEPYTLVLTETTARRYFGDAVALADVVGESMEVDGMDMTVTGIAADPPGASHFTFDFVGAFETLVSEYGADNYTNWWNLSYYTYFLLHPEADPVALGASIRELPRLYIPEQEDRSGYRQFLYLQPLTDIHLTSHYEDELGANSYTAYVWAFGAIAVFILLLAVINFMNLATARSAQRAREVGMRKALGADRGQLARQFLGESVLYAVAALLVALALIQIALPLFNGLAGKDLSVSYLSPLLPALVAFALGVGLLAGSYPAFVLSAFRPAAVLKGQRTPKGQGEGLRKGLVVFQFAVSVALVVGALVVGQQLRFMQTQNLGFDKDRLIAVDFDAADVIGGSLDVFRSALEETPAIRSVTFSSAVPGTTMPTNVIAREPGMTEAGQTFIVLPVEYDFVETYGLDVIAGRAFDRARADSASFILNETALRRLGWTDPQEALGVELTRQFGDTRTVVGVVQDFHLEGLQSAIPPVVLYYRPQWCDVATIRVQTDEIPAALAGLEAAWGRLAPDRPLDYVFLDDDFDQQYRAERRIAAVVQLFTGLALAIACLGLLGLVSFTTQQRTQEIGVRKVLGASVSSVVVLLTKDFTRLIAVAVVVAAPLAWFAMDRWLDGFAYRIAISPLTFLVAGGLAMAVAWTSVSILTVRAARANPVDSLRAES